MNTYLLAKGSHKSVDDGRCAMEWVSYLAGEPHSDQPVCVSPTLREFCISLNDNLPEDQRQRMRPYLARTIGTARDGLDEARRWMCADWLIREYTPTWLALVPDLVGHAERLRALPAIVSTESVHRAMVDLSQARSDAAAAGDAAGAAAWAAVRDAARDAARAAAGAAAGAAVRAAAGDVLNPSVTALQNSILMSGGLLDRMLPTEVVQIPVASNWREICEVS